MTEVPVEFLLKHQNSDGGWSAGRGKVPNAESTAFAAMALSSKASEKTEIRVRQGLDWLSRHQNSDGGFRISDATVAGSWSTAVVLLCLSVFPEYRPQALAGARWALTQQGRTPGWVSTAIQWLMGQQDVNKLDASLTGWPWIAGTFSWVEPTSYFVIALKKMKASLQDTNVDERIREAELMIYDRVCESGGWNYGNSKVYGEALWPYPDTTAIALLALQDHRDGEPVRRSLDALEKMIADVDSGLALSWTIICFDVFGRETAHLRDRLVRRFEETKFLGETKSLALSVLALTEGARFFRIQ